MPRAPPSGWEQQKVEEEIFLEFHVKPKLWGEARLHFVKRLASRVGYPRDRGQLPEKKERDLRRNFFNLHRRAIRNEWIRKVDRAWELAPLGLAHLQGRPVRPDDFVASDLHDKDLKDFLVLVHSSLESRGFAVTPPEWPRAEFRDFDAGIQKDRLFRDLKWHVQVMDLPEAANLGKLYADVSELSRSVGRQRLAIERQCRKILRDSYAPWGSRRPGALKGPIVAGLTILEEMASVWPREGSHRTRPERTPAILRERAARQREAWRRLSTPELVGNEVRAGGFVLAVDGRPQALAHILKAWPAAARSVRARALPSYRRYIGLRGDLEQATLRYRLAIRHLELFPHFPGICVIRRASQPRGSVS